MAIFAMANSKRRGRREIIMSKLIKAIQEMEEGWCYTTGVLIKMGNLRSRDVYYQLKKIKELGLFREVYIPCGDYDISLLCKGEEVKGVKVINGSKIVSITKERAKEYVDNILRSMKSKTYHMKAASIIRELGVSKSSASILAIAYIMWLTNSENFKGLVRAGSENEPKTYFLFEKL